MKRTGIVFSAGCLILTLYAGAAGERSFEQPALITSAGQGAEVQIASVLAKRAGITASLSKTATADDLAGTHTIILVLGVSMKGLGAAGLDMAQEEDRVSRLLQAAQKNDIPILGMHLGGEARRGSLSDEVIKKYLPSCDTLIIVKTGNADGMITELCRKANIPMVEVEKTVAALEPLKKLFKTDGSGLH